MKIYHNPKCSKSRQAKKVLDDKKVDYTTHLYLNDPLTEQNLQDLVGKLGLSIKDIIRTKESIWKENFKDGAYSDEELVQIVANNPRLLERPIIEYNDFAVVARSDDKIVEILEKL